MHIPMLQHGNAFMIVYAGQHIHDHLCSAIHSSAAAGIVSCVMHVNTSTVQQDYKVAASGPTAWSSKLLIICGTIIRVINLQPIDSA